MKTKNWPTLDRRTFMKGAAVAGLTAISAEAAHAEGGLTMGDAAILRFLAAAEILETDAWQQYHELASGNPAYKEALEVIDDDNPEYVEQNTDDEFSHADFINAYLRSTGRQPVSLEAFRTLKS